MPYSQSFKVCKKVDYGISGYRRFGASPPLAFNFRGANIWNRKDKPDQEAVFVLRFVEGNCIRLQRKVDRMNQKSGITLLFAARVLQFSDDEFENNEWR